MTELSTIKDTFVTIINERLKELLAVKEVPQKELFAAAGYSLHAPCKRLRPLLVLSILHGYEIPLALGLDPASAIEMVHTYSLIHDDLPCMDNDDLRRGRPTLHKVYPEGLAVLTGDFLLTYAFEILADSKKLSDHQKIRLIQVLSKRSGAHGMIGGQVVDIASIGQSFDWDVLHFMHLHKTAALFTASLEFGAIISDLSQEDFKIIQKCGETLGVAFQMIDDLQDDPTLKQDTSNSVQKPNAVSLLGIQKTQEKAKILLDTALVTSRELTKPCPLLELIIKELLEHIPAYSY